MLVNFRTAYEETIWIAADKIVSLKEYHKPGFLELRVLAHSHSMLIIQGDLNHIVKNINASLSYTNPR